MRGLRVTFVLAALLTVTSVGRPVQAAPRILDPVSDASAAVPEPAAGAAGRRPDPSAAGQPQALVPPSEITFTARFAQQASEAQSLMLFHNPGASAGTVTLTIRDRTGTQLGQWVSPSVLPGATLQFDSRDLAASVPGNFNPPGSYSVTLQTAMKGSFQHLLVRPSSNSVTNLSTCDSGVSTERTRLIGVRASRPNDPSRSRVVVHNTGPVTADATLTIYDASDGTKLGTYAIADIPPGGLVVSYVADIEAAAQIAQVPGRTLYVVRANPGLPGYVQHLLRTAGFLTDLTATCAVNGFPDTAPRPVTRVALHSTGRDNARSVLRFHNSDGPGGATVSVTLRDEITGTVLGVWTSPPIALGGTADFPIGTIETGAVPNTFTIPDHYSADLRSGFQGRVQHVLADRSTAVLTDLSTCDAGTTVERTRVIGAASSLLAGTYRSAVVVHNLGASASSVALDVYDAAGVRAGTYTTASIPAKGFMALTVSTIEAGAGIVPTPQQRQWVIRASGAFTGFLQHLLEHPQADVTTDMTATCALAVSPAPVAASFYVAPNGNDSWTGTLAEPNGGGTDGPFLTFGRAQTAVAALPKTAPPDIVVQLRAGRYFQSPNVLLQAADSGTAATRVVYRNYPGETPVVSGGKRVENWVNVSANRWEAALPAGTVNFESLFYNDARRLRPRLGGGLGTYLRIGDPIYVSTSETNCPTLDPTPPDPAKPYLCFDRFTYSGADLDAAATWTNLAPAAGNRCGQAAGNAALKGDIEMLVFEKHSAAKLRVECIDAVSKTVFFTGPSNFTLDVSGFIDDHRYLVENVKEALTEPGQWFLDRSASPWTLVYLAHEAEDPNADFVIIPQQTHVLQASTLSYTTFQGLSFEHDDYVVPDAGQPGDDTFKKSTPAVSLTNSSNITFDGVTVARTSGFGIWFTVCLQKVVGANVVNAGGNPSWCPAGGYSLTPSVTNNVIRNSAFYDLGASAIGIGFQHRADMSDTDANVPQFVTVENNVIAGYGRVLPNAFGTYQGTAHDITYTHNDVYDGYRVAFHICPCNRNFRGPSSNGAFNNVISYNHVHDLMQGITNDGGAIRILSGFPGLQASGNKILNNVVHDINDASAIGDADGYGGDGIYIDDGTSNIEVAYNLVYRVTRAAMNITQNADVAGYENNIHDNVFAYARLAMIQNNRPYPNGTVPTPAIRVFSARNNIFYFTRSGASAPAFYAQGGCAYSGGYPFDEFQLRANNLYWRTDGAFASDLTAFRYQPTQGLITGDPAKDINTICNLSGTHTYRTFAEWQAFIGWCTTALCTVGSGQDIGSTVQDPGFTSPAYPYDDFTLPAASVGAAVVNTTLYQPQLAGRTSATFTPAAVPATFPTATFDRATGF